MRKREKISVEICYAESELYERLLFYAKDSGKVARGYDVLKFVEKYRNKWVPYEEFEKDLKGLFISVKRFKIAKQFTMCSNCMDFDLDEDCCKLSHCKFDNDREE